MVNYIYPSFKKVDKHLERRLDNQISGFYLVKFYEKLKMYNIEHLKYNDQDLEFVLLHFLTLQNEIHKKWKNTKLIVLFYDQFENIDIDIFDSHLKSELIKNGIIVVSTKDLVGKYLSDGYILSEKDIHPNEKAWNEIVPKLVEKMEL